jgi:hypothetical protein
MRRFRRSCAARSVSTMRDHVGELCRSLTGGRAADSALRRGGRRARLAQDSGGMDFDTLMQRSARANPWGES